MKKLNNRGWGLVVMIAFMGIFFLAILVIAILSTRYGLLNTEKQDVNSTEKLTTTNQKYLNYEQIIKQVSTEYVDKNYSDITSEDVIYININDLDIDEIIKEECDGYIEVYKKDKVYYEPYIKCSTYETQGYDKTFNQLV